MTHLTPTRECARLAAAHLTKLEGPKTSLQIVKDFLDMASEKLPSHAKYGKESPSRKRIKKPP